jgi:hypothetical protein
LQLGAIEAGKDIVLAVGKDGVIDLRGNNANVFKATGKLFIYSDTILLDDGVSLEDLADVAEIVVEPSKILYLANITGQSQMRVKPNTTVPVKLTLSNIGPTKDTYTLSVKQGSGLENLDSLDMLQKILEANKPSLFNETPQPPVIPIESANWETSTIPASITVDGLSQTGLALDITAPANIGDEGIIIVTATSQNDPSMVVTFEIRSVVVNNPIVDVSVDSDSDGVMDEFDDFPSEPQEWMDSDKDGVGNNADTDDDNDGMPDRWEAQYNHLYVVFDDAARDNDSDGYSNLEEYNADTNPVDASSYPGAVVNVAPATCQLYAVNDKGLNNSQFFTVSLDDLTISELGPMYKGHDIEALAIHPKTDMIYAASGDNVTNGKPGHFYQVDGETGQIIPVGSTGFNEIEDLAFSPDGTLYAWAKDDGLITIDLATGNGTLVLDSNIQLEGLTLKKNEGNVFFGAVGTDLLRYDGATNTLEVLCPNQLLGETEALEITPEGLLLVGTHNVPFGLHAFDAQTCQVIEADETLSNKFYDVEGIALPVAACSS